VDVPDELVDLAVKRAVDRETNLVVRRATCDIVDSTKRDIQKEVKSSVENVYSDIRASVSKEISYQVANLDINKMKSEVKEKAKELVLEKFDGNLNSLLEDFNQSLSNVSKIYESIAESMSKKKDSDTIFRIER
jgi:hypothetical protein